MQRPDRDIAIEFISVFGMPPVAFVELAANLGVTQIGMALTPIEPNPHNYPPWSLRDNAALRRDLKAALSANGVSISLGEGFLIMPGVEMGDSGGDMDLLRELGARRINALSIDPDRDRSFDQYARLAEMAAERGMEATLEFLPGFPIGDLQSALAAIRHVGKPNFSVLIDAMHFFRSGSSLADLAAADPLHIGYVQLCDVPLVSKSGNYGEEARCERIAPGKGELPLRDLVAALPRTIPMGVETPMLSQALRGEGPYDRLAPCLSAARALLS